MERSLGLDILRASAIIFVLLNHGLYIIYDTLPGFFGNVLTSYGHFGVGIFFVLSGFLVGTIFIRDVLLKEGTLNQLLLKFWLRRWFRTLPNYYLFLLIYIGILFISQLYEISYTQPNLQLESVYLLWSYPFFLQNFISDNPSFFGQAWSLSVEEWFYLLLPLPFCVLITTTLKSNGKFICRVLLILVTALLIWKYYCFFYWQSLYNQFKVVFNLDKIMVGVFLGALNFFYKEYLQRYRRICLWLGLSLWLLVHVIYIKFILVSNPFLGAELWTSLISSVSFTLLIIYFLDFKLENNIVAKVARVFSFSFYSLYLSHFLFLIFLVDNFLLRIPVFNDTGVGRWLTFCLFILFNTWFSYLHYKRFEQPVMNIRDYKLFKKLGNVK